MNQLFIAISRFHYNYAICSFNRIFNLLTKNREKNNRKLPVTKRFSFLNVKELIISSDGDENDFEPNEIIKNLFKNLEAKMRMNEYHFRYNHYINSCMNTFLIYQINFESFLR